MALRPEADVSWPTHSSHGGRKDPEPAAPFVLHADYRSVVPPVLLPERVPMSTRIYLDVNTSLASSGASNQPVHRQGEDVNAIDQLSSPVLLGIGVVGAIVADLLISLMIG